MFAPLLTAHPAYHLIPCTPSGPGNSSSAAQSKQTRKAERDTREKGNNEQSSNIDDVITVKFPPPTPHSNLKKRGKKQEHDPYKLRIAS